MARALKVGKDQRINKSDGRDDLETNAKETKAQLPKEQP